MQNKNKQKNFEYKIKRKKNIHSKYTPNFSF